MTMTSQSGARSLDPCSYVAGEQWYVVRTRPHDEVRADQNLRAGGIETFLPRTRLRSRTLTAPPRAGCLFPQYLFAWFDPIRRLHDVCFTRGVQGVVRIGSALARVDDDVVTLLRSRVGADGLIKVGKPLEPWERVQIEAGPFAQLIGVIERHLPESERVIVLLTSVELSARVELPVSAVRRVPAAAHAGASSRAQ